MERTCDDALEIFRNEGKAANKEHLEATKELEELAKVCKEAVRVPIRMRAERDGTSEKFHQALPSIRKIVKARDEGKDMTVGPRTKVFLVYKEGQKDTAPPQVENFLELMKRVTELEEELEGELRLQMLPGLAEENATFW